MSDCLEMYREALLKAAEQRFSARAFTRDLLQEVMGVLAPYCAVPEKFRSCTLEATPLSADGLTPSEIDGLLENPPAGIIPTGEAQLEAIALLKMFLATEDPVCEGRNFFQPRFGIYFFGPSGVAKTHLMAAFALEVETRLKKSVDSLAILAQAEVEKYVKAALDSGEGFEESKIPPRFEISDDSALTELDSTTRQAIMRGEKVPGQVRINKKLNAVEQFAQEIEALKGRINRWSTRPSDLLFLTFDELCELYANQSRSEAIHDAVSEAKYLFIDDVHPRDESRVEVIRSVIETRYNLGQNGLFFTANVEEDELGGSNTVLGTRLKSRLGEMLYTVDFKGCTDWRTAVRGCRVSAVKTLVQERVAAWIKQDGFIFPTPKNAVGEI